MMQTYDFAIGQQVIVAHGVRGWKGIVSRVWPGTLIVDYPGGNRPGDDMPARESVDLSRHRVTLA